MPKWILLLIFFISQCALIGVIFANFFFEAFARKIFPPSYGSEPTMGIGGLIVYVLAALFIIVLALISSFAIKNFLIKDFISSGLAIFFFLLSYIIQSFIAPSIHDKQLQKHLYQSIKIDVHTAYNQDQELTGLISQEMRDFNFKGDQQYWFFEHLKSDTEVRKLLTSVFKGAGVLRMTKSTAFLILPEEFFWRHIVVDGSNKTYTASYDFKDDVVIGEDTYRLSAVDNFDTESGPYLKIANAIIFGNDRLGLHFRIVNTPYRFVVFVKGSRLQNSSYSKFRYKSLYHDSLIWNEEK